MNINVKLTLILIFCAVTSACTTTSSLNRDLVHQEKIKTVYVNQMSQNVSVESTNSNSTVGFLLGGPIGYAVGSAVDSNVKSKKQKELSNIQDNINNFSVNAVLKTALQHNLVGNAFADNVIIDSNFDSSIKKPYLIPVLKPSVTISSDYRVVSVQLKTSTTHKASNGTQKQYKGVYTSQKFVGGNASSTDKESNKQFWTDNPILLKEKIVNALYDVAQQFANDFNAQASY